MVGAEVAMAVCLLFKGPHCLIVLYLSTEKDLLEVRGQDGCISIAKDTV